MLPNKNRMAFGSSSLIMKQNIVTYLFCLLFLFISFHFFIIVMFVYFSFVNVQ